MIKRAIKDRSTPMDRTSTRGAIAAVVSLVAALLAIAVTPAFAKPVESPGWEIDSHAFSTNLEPGGTGIVVVDVYNIGEGASTGTATVIDKLPPGLEATEAAALSPIGWSGEVEGYEATDDENVELEKMGLTGVGTERLRVWDCTGKSTVECTNGPGYKGVRRPIPSGYVGRIGIVVHVTGAPGIEENHVSISGGGAMAPAEASSSLTISNTPATFGASAFDGWFSNADGTIDTQAGSHPFSMAVNFDMNAIEAGPAGDGLRDLSIALPAGIVGNPHAVPQCTRQQFMSSIEGGCPPDTQVGVDYPGIGPEGGFGIADLQLRFPVFNLVPPPGIPAEFGFSAQGSLILVDFGVRSGGDYGITGAVHNLAYKATSNSLTLWGVPDESVHNIERCGRVSEEFAQKCGFKGSSTIPKPLLTVPTACEGSQVAHLTARSWNPSEPVVTRQFTFHDATGDPVGFSGCEHLSFGPSLSASPDTTFADMPAGLTVDVQVPQEGLNTVGELSTSNIKDTTVTLPEGVVINPGQAAGLGACGPAEDGLTTDTEKAEGKENNGPAHCPNSAKVGTDEIETPLLSKPLKGSVYVMPSNPPHVQLLVTAEGEGVFLKLVGDVHLNEQTGQLVTTFSNTPELPFTDFKLSFSGGAQAALSTPLRCGVYSTTSDFAAWSAPLTQDVFPSSTFAISAGVGGAACPAGGPLPFGPSMIAGSTTDQAGGFTDFSLLLTRPDDQQRVTSLQFKTPEGLLGMISKVPLCPGAQANAGTCSAASQIGHTVVEAGPGPYPLVVPQPGQPPAPIYLTEGYKGAPYGLSIVVPLHVGPFVLPTQIVRAKIEVDPRTTELTVTTDALPQVIAGVPADLRAINAVIDKPGFMFNPTGCQPGSFSGTATGTEGANVPISTHFQMGSCKSLTFKPNFKVSTNAKTSRKQGASLDATIVYPHGPFPDNQASIQSNVKAVKVALPKVLPSRLTTLQKACPAKTFEANPTGCPAGSVVGSASAETPVLPVKLTGPAYFVSYGGAKFPELVVELQGYGVTVQLHGETFISEKTNITTSTFRQVPDVPITKFELKLPQGPNSALAAIGNLCAKKLVMPTIFTGQNGAQIKQNTPIAVKGCTKHKNKPHKKHNKKKK